jgi:putative peptide zinc metalloprotease protein
LFHPLAVSAAVLLILAAVVVPAPDAALPRLSGWYHLMVFVVLSNLVSILHECGHGIALHHYGGSAREIGSRFVLGWPCWYCDITESYLLPRLRQRLAVIIAGPFVQAAACAFLVLLARSPEPHLVVLRRAAALLGVLSVLNFFPLIRSDGYYLLTELAGMPNLRTDAWRWLTSAGARLEMRRLFSCKRRIGVAAYGLASCAFLTIVLTRAVVAIGRAFAGTGRVSLHTVEAVFSVVIILTMIPRRRSV